MRAIDLRLMPVYAIDVSVVVTLLVNAVVGDEIASRKKLQRALS